MYLEYRLVVVVSEPETARLESALSVVTRNVMLQCIQDGCELRWVPQG